MIIHYQNNENQTVTVTFSKTDFDAHFTFCADCGCIIWRQSAVRIDEDYYCEHCTTTCDICGRAIRTADAYNPADSDWDYCRSCYARECYRCDDCGDRFRYEDSLTEIDGCWYCENCRDDHRSYINAYHTMKHEGNLTFYGDADRSDTVYMGFELEVDADHSIDRNDIALELRNRFGSFMEYENDGSLQYGFEMISHPATLDYHLSMMPKYREAFRYLVDQDIFSHNVGSCGFHHHLDRRYFGNKEESSIAKMLYLFERFRSELMIFSRRTEEQAADWCRSRKQNYRGEAGWIKKAVKESRGYPDHQSRYYAVNLTNSNTIELRLWRGTLRPDTFEATLRFSARLAEVCKNIRAVELAKMTFEDLLGSDEVILSYWHRINH